MIVCCGEALIDMVPQGSADGGQCYRPVPGGAIFNTAVALGRLGDSVGLIAGLSRDMFGEQLADHLSASHVDTGYCVLSDRPTTLAFVKLTDGRAEYLFYDEASAARMIGPEGLPTIPGSVQALHFGAISLISEPCGTTFEHLALAQHQKHIISLDPNIRTSFIDDEQAFRSRLKRMIAISDIIKVSDEDLDWIEPGSDFQTVAARWIADGASLVALTMGDKGARAITAGLDVTVAGRHVDIVDTIGAGDAFDAGMLSCLSKLGCLNKDQIATITAGQLESVLEYANAIAAITVSRVGADPPWRDELSL